MPGRGADYDGLSGIFGADLRHNYRRGSGRTGSAGAGRYGASFPPKSKPALSPAHYDEPARLVESKGALLGTVLPACVPLSLSRHGGCEWILRNTKAPVG